MHSAMSRANAALTFFGSAVAALCALTALTDLWHGGEPRVDLKLNGVTRLAPYRGRYDQAVLSVALDADLSPAFSWNTKQLFVFVQAEYETDDVSSCLLACWLLFAVAVWLGLSWAIAKQQGAVICTLRLLWPDLRRGLPARRMPAAPLSAACLPPAGRP